MNTSKKHLVFVGPSGVGKTTIGTKVSKSLGMKFVDLDDLIVKKINCPIHEFFEKEGEEAFRKIESETLLEVLQSEDPTLLTPGAGCILSASNIAQMKKYAIVVFLNAQIKDIISRVKEDKINTRPLLVDNIDRNVKEQYDKRIGAYELAQDISIGTSNRDEDAVTDAVVRQIERFVGEKSDISSQIVAGMLVLGTIGEYLKSYSSVFIISQHGIPSVYKDIVLDSLESNEIKCHMIFIPEGEDGKSIEAYGSVLNQMAQLGANRSSCVVALGGGVVGDLTGYVGSTFMRGIDVIQVPTTLLAQVDSSIGGKNGINLKAGKNLVGTITQPKIIVADSNCLATLPQSDYLSGLGEVVKYGLLGNITVFELIEKHAKEILNRDGEVLAAIIRSCMKHKVHVVSRDPFERNGMRATLNLGHTLAHVLEKATDFKIAHGDAVAIGLRYISLLSLELEMISKDQHLANIALIDSLKLGTDIPSRAVELGADQLVKWMLGDKKSSGDMLNMVLFSSEGTPKLVKDVDITIATNVLDDFLTSA